MKQTENIILKSLSSYIHNISLNDNFDNISSEQWQDIYQLAKTHSIIPVVYETMKDNPSFCQNNDKLKQKWKQKSMSLVIKQIQLSSAFLDIYQKIKEQNIDCIVTKGIILREMYKKKEWRVSGDEDILIKKADYQKVCQIFLDQHYQLVNDFMDDHIQVTTFVDPSTQLNIELHIALFEEDSYLGFLNKEFKNIFDNSKYIQIEGTSIQVMNDLDQIFYLICHSFKHFINTGVGLRQLMDICQYTRLHQQNINWQTLINKLNQIHALEFTKCIYQIGQNYFDINDINYPSYITNHIDYGDFLADIFDSGIFGIHEDKRIYSNLYVRRIFNENKKQTSLLSLVFPSLKKIRSSYPILYKYPYLLPYIWLKRIIRFNHRYHHSKNTQNIHMKEAKLLGDKRIKLLKKYKIIE